MPQRTDRNAALFLTRMMDDLPSMLAYWDRDLRCRFANRAYERWFGVAPEALIGTSIRDLLGPKLFALNEPYIRGALAGQPQTFERIVPGPHGVQRHSLALYAPDRVDGEVLGFVAQVTEVTAIKQTEERLRASEAFLDRAGRLAGVGGWEVDLRRQTVTWSDRTRRIHEVGPEYQPRLGTGIAFYAPEARPVVEAAVKAALEHGTPWDLELPLVTATGRPIWVRTIGEVEFEDGVAARLLGAIQDITLQRERRLELLHEQALRQEIERHSASLDRLLRERSEMLDVMAHEVRQPLHNAAAALRAAASTLAGESPTSQRLTQAQAVLGRVMDGIDNTLAVASLLARPDPIQREDTDVDTLLALAIGDMPDGERDRVRIQRDSATRTASMDMGLMRLALRNLLSNALKYSPAGAPVTLRVGDSDAPLALVIDVADLGPGIPEALRPRLFERGARGRNGSGQGLGLYIVRRVMELHGGRVELLRDSPQGTTMRLLVEQAG